LARQCPLNHGAPIGPGNQVGAPGSMLPAKQRRESFAMLEAMRRASIAGKQLGRRAARCSDMSRIRGEAGFPMGLASWAVSADYFRGLLKSTSLMLLTLQGVAGVGYGSRVQPTRASRRGMPRLSDEDASCRHRTRAQRSAQRYVSMRSVRD
jgi:hypothetical protein